MRVEQMNKALGFISVVQRMDVEILKGVAIFTRVMTQGAAARGNNFNMHGLPNNTVRGKHIIQKLKHATLLPSKAPPKDKAPPKTAYFAEVALLP